jgi:hypothetical protein
LESGIISTLFSGIHLKSFLSLGYIKTIQMSALLPKSALSWQIGDTKLVYRNPTGSPRHLYLIKNLVFTEGLIRYVLSENSHSAKYNLRVKFQLWKHRTS